MAEFINQMEPWIDANEVDHMSEYLNSGAWLTEFKKTEEFENRIAEYTGSRFCCVVPNGTVSLAIALWAYGIGPGDEILVPDLTMIASANAVKMVGAVPVLVDIEPETLCMDLSVAKRSLTASTKGVILVTLNGRSPAMTDWRAFCTSNDLFFLEDAAQSLGSFHRGKHLGTFGEVGSFSFSAPKIITTGQGGALVTDNEGLFREIKLIKDFGRIRGGTDWHESLGYNFKFTDIQAVIGIEQMKKLPWRVARKKEIFQLYRTELGNISEIEFIPTSEETSPWFIDIFVRRRDELIEYLKKNNIGSRPLYPPIHCQKIYKRSSEKFPVAEQYCNAGLWLPSSSFLSDKQVREICRIILGFFSG